MAGRPGRPAAQRGQRRPWPAHRGGAVRNAGPGQAGQRLTTDAKAALLGPVPPRAVRLYRAALTDLERAGRSAAGGRLRAAGASLRAGETALTQVTAAANAPAPAGSAVAPVREPAG